MNEVEIKKNLAIATSRLSRIISLRDLIENPPPPIDYLVQNLLPVGGCLMIAAPPKQGKTFFAIEMARAIATGQPFLGKFETKKGRVLYIDEENGRITLFDRLSKFWKGNTHTIEEAEQISFLIKDGITLDNITGTTFLGIAMDEYKPSVVILDSAVRLMEGDENSATDVRRVFESFSALLEEGLSVVILHHNNKINKGVQRNRVRGSGDWTAMVDVLMWVNKKKHYFLAGVAEHRHMDTSQLLDFTVNLNKSNEGLILTHEGVTAKERTAPQRALDALIQWGKDNCLKDPWQRTTALNAITNKKHSKDSFNKAMTLAENDRLIVKCDDRQWQFVPGAFAVEEKVSDK